MAELCAVGSAASILSIITAALYGARALYNFIKDVKNTPKEIRSIRQEASALEYTLDALHSCMQSGIIHECAAGLLRGSLAACCSHLNQLRRLLRRFTHKGEWNSAFVWRWSRDEIERLRTNISHSKQTLGLSLAVLQTHAIEAGNQQLSQKIDTAIQPIRSELFSFYQYLLDREEVQSLNTRYQPLQSKDRIMAQTICLADLPAGSHPWAQTIVNDSILSSAKGSTVFELST